MNEERKKYQLTIFASNYVQKGDSYEHIESPIRFVLDWDGVQNLLGYMAEGLNGNRLKFEIKEEL